MCASLPSRLAVAAHTLLLVCGTAAAQDVPAQTSPSSPPCTKTISAGVGLLQPSLEALRPGDVLCLRGGTYKTGAAFGTPGDRTLFAPSGTPERYITLKAYEDEVPVIRGLFRISGNYLKISGLTFEGPLNPDPSSPQARRDNLVEFIENHHVLFLRNEVRHSDYHAGIYLKRVHHVSIADCDIHHNGRFLLVNDPKTGARTVNVDHGIYWGSSSGGGNIVSGNRIHANRGYGLHLYPRAYDITVVNNQFYDNGNSGVIVAGDSDRITISGNISAYNGRNAQIRVRSGNQNVVADNQTWSDDPELAGIENDTRSAERGNKIARPEPRPQAAQEKR